jgi:hypothetical protein
LRIVGGTPAWRRKRTSRAVRLARHGQLRPNRASIVRALPIRRRSRSTLLDAGQNPPNGVVVHQHLPDPPPREVTLTLTAASSALRRFDSTR